MFTLVGYSENQDSAGAFVGVAPIPDPHVRVEGDFIVVPELNRVICALAMGAGISRARLTAPSLRSFITPEINPVVDAAALTETHLLRQRADYNLLLTTDEQLSAEIIETTSGAEMEKVFVWLADELPQQVDGEMFTVRATHPAIAAALWSNVAITLEQALPVGRYACVGARHESATASAFRFQPVGELYRPGGVSAIALGNVDPPGQRRGGWGVWFEFDQLRPPTIEVHATAADASGVVYLDLMRL